MGSSIKMYRYDYDIIPRGSVDNPQHSAAAFRNRFVGSRAFRVARVGGGRVRCIQGSLNPMDGDPAFFDRLQRVLGKPDHALPLPLSHKPEGKNSSRAGRA